MSIAEEVINQINSMPVNLQKEVLNFAHYLKQKAEQEETDNLMYAQHSSMEHIWDNQDDEVWDNVPVR